MRRRCADVDSFSELQSACVSGSSRGWRAFLRRGLNGKLRDFGYCDESLGRNFAAVTRPAGYRLAQAIHPGDEAFVDLFGHGEHQAGGLLHRPGIIREARRGTAGDYRVSFLNVAGDAPDSKFTAPLLHEVVNLGSSETRGQDLQVNWRWKRFSLSL